MGGDWSADQTPPILSDKYQCRIDTAFSPDDGHMNVRNMQRRELNKYIKQNFAASCTYLGDYTGIHCQQNIKFSMQI